MYISPLSYILQMRGDNLYLAILPAKLIAVVKNLVGNTYFIEFQNSLCYTETRAK